MTHRPPALRTFVVALSLCLMLILPVSAVEQIVLQDSEDTYFTYSLTKRRTVIDHNVYRKINIYDGSAVRSYDSLYVKAEVAPAGSGAEQTAHARIRERPSDYTNVTLKYNGAVVATANVGYNTFFANDGYTLKNIQWWVENIEWISTDSIPAGYVQLLVSDYSMDFALFGSYLYLICCTDAGPDAAKPVVFGDKYVPDYVFGNYVVSGTIRWQNTVEIDKNPDELFGYIRIFRDGYSSTVSISSDAGTYTDNSARNLNYRFIGPGNWSVNSPIGRSFAGTFGSNADPGDPGAPGDAILRTGTVTMTDNNGTTITGFEVTAVNAYTGENYTVSTESDIAVITLPMDRTIQIRNPQTGEYEEAPIGYYRFYGQSPGYKMLNEDGIQVAVMPEKYTSYELCIILVTPESGPLTGKHQFQIRSRSDNSILQTGTVSAKSATTGNWYNTTVSGGIATLILPYDTSNPISQYAGNYYVYATSPGYQENDYGTQIVVMPHTVSEIKSILLTPIGGIPTPGNVTLRIQAFSEYGPGVPNASIFIAGVDGAGSSVWDTYTASSTGYLTVSVPGNSTYDIVASGAGFYDSARRVTVYDDDPPLIEIKLYLSGAPTLEPTTQPTGWPTDRPTTQPTGGIPDVDDDSEGFLMEAVRGIGLAFGVGFATAKLIFGMLLALSIGYATAKQLRGGAAEFGLGLLGGTLLGVLIGLLPVWIIVVLLLVVGLYIGNRYVGGGNNG